MNRVSHKQSADREAKYLPYKSYHNIKPRHSKSSSQEEQKSSTSSEPPKVKKSSSKCEQTAVRRQISGYKGDNIAGSESEIRALKHSESQTTDVFLEDNEKLKEELALLLNAKCKMDEEMMELKAINEDLRNKNESLRRNIAEVELKNEELEDQFELNSDQIKELLKWKDESAERVRELKLNICELESNICKLENERDAAISSSEESERLNKELIQLINELHNMTREKDRTVDQLTCFKKKWESYKIKLDEALIEKQELADRIAKDAHFVAVLETDVKALQQNNEELKSRNDQLQRNMTERKKNEELLRQKYDELKKQNRSLKENGSIRYSVYDAASKYSSAGSKGLSTTIIGREDTSNRDLRELSTSLMNTFSEKSNKKSQDSSYYNLLHRLNNSERVPKNKKP